MGLLDRVRAEEARRERRQREDLDALSHATGGATVRPADRMSPFTRRALRGELPASDRTGGR